jgi:membrane protease YdiL (CAAX protease family)
MLPIAIILILIASILPDIIAIELSGSVPIWLSLAKMLVLFGACIPLLLSQRFKQLWKFSFITGSIVTVQLLIKLVAGSSWWQSAFDTSLFVENFGSAILLKFIGTLPIIGLLIVLFKSRQEAYLTKGDLSVKADRIRWLGIHENWISWRKLSIISAILISLGTLLLTILTVTGFSVPDTIDQLFNYFPFIVLFALVNSFSEGIIYRSAILAPLKSVFHKNQVVVIAAVFFGIAHYYGAPSGVVGVVMSTALGWFMCRSMYETKGFASSWIIHFMQDVVIFSTLSILAGYR